MITISLCMIVKDEEAVLARCLDCVKDIADEIIIVDTGSTDDTKKIALKYTDKVYDFEWIEDFSAARNFAYSKASMDYQMWLDADDVIPEESVQKLLSLKETLSPSYDIVTMKYFTHFDANGVPIMISTRERLTRREKDYKWADPVHECIALVGNIYYSDIEIYHKKVKFENQAERNLRIYDNLERTQQAFTPRQMYYYARELQDHGIWNKSVYYFEKFLETKLGWVEDNIATCFNLSHCYGALGLRDKILPILFKSFEYDAPRAEVCCEIGYFYKNAQNFSTSYKWFRLAANLGEPDTIGFILKDYWGYVPNIECCVCLCELGDILSAYEYNEKAASFKPDAESIKINRAYFATKLNVAQ